MHRFLQEEAPSGTSPSADPGKLRHAGDQDEVGTDITNGESNGGLQGC